MAMRLLFVTNERGLRGGERQVALLGRALAGRGDVVALCAPKDAELRRDWPGACLDVSMANSLDLVGALDVRRAVRDSGAELVHAFTSRAHALARMARLDVPLVVTRPVAFVAGKGFGGRAKYRSRVAAFIAVSNVVRDGLLAAGADSSRVEVIAPGVPLRTVALEEAKKLRSRLALPGDWVLGSVGAIEPAKGYDLMLTAMSSLVREGIPARWFQLGEGPQQAELEKRAYELGLTDRVHWFGRSTSVEALLGAIDVFVSPSRSEGFGMAVVEALGAGVPCVVSDSGGVRDILRHQQDGLLVANGDAAELARALVRVRSEPELIERFRRSGPERAKLFTVESMVERTIALYRRVLAR